MIYKHPVIRSGFNALGLPFGGDHADKALEQQGVEDVERMLIVYVPMNRCGVRQRRNTRGNFVETRFCRYSDHSWEKDGQESPWQITGYPGAQGQTYEGGGRKLPLENAGYDL